MAAGVSFLDFHVEILAKTLTSSRRTWRGRVLFPGTSCEAEFCFRGYSITNGVLLAQCAAAGKCRLADVCGSYFFFFARTQSCMHFCALLPTLAAARCSNLAALSLPPLSFVYTHALSAPHPSSPLPTHSLSPSSLSPHSLFLSNTLTHARALFGSKGSVAYKLAAVSSQPLR